MAEKRLQNLERRLSKIIEGHVEKGYITKLSPVEDESSVTWYLPHFPVERQVNHKGTGCI